MKAASSTTVAAINLFSAMEAFRRRHTMDHDSRLPLSRGARAVNVAAAKRLSAAVRRPPLPRLGEIYKGSGALYLAFFLMMVVEDWATGVVDRTLGGRLGDESRHLVSARPGRRRRCSSARRWRA